MVKRDNTQQSKFVKSILVFECNHKGMCRICMNCLNSFCTVSARGKYYECSSSNGHAKVKMPSEKENWLKFHNGEYQF